MERRTWCSIAIALATLGAPLVLSGCHGCDEPRRAVAQSLDGGAVVIAPIPSSAAGCFIRAQRETRLTDAQIEALCLGAPVPWGPVNCYVSARRNLTLTDDQHILLCRCSGSAEPVSCFRRMNSETGLTDAQIQQMCSPTLSLGLLQNCRPIGGYY